MIEISSVRSFESSGSEAEVGSGSGSSEGEVVLEENSCTRRHIRVSRA